MEAEAQKITGAEKTGTYITIHSEDTKQLLEETPRSTKRKTIAATPNENRAARKTPQQQRRKRKTALSRAHPQRKRGRRSTLLGFPPPSSKPWGVRNEPVHASIDAYCAAWPLTPLTTLGRTAHKLDRNPMYTTSKLGMALINPRNSLVVF